MTKTSVALCTYNGERFLLEQLNSFLQQTRLPDELVVGDDCSSDNTASIIKDFAESAPFPVRLYINEINAGSTKNFEQTIFRCKGDVIFLADQDDFWLPEKIEKTNAVFEALPEVGFVFTDAQLVDVNLNPLGVNLWQAAFTKEEQEKARAGKLLEVLIRRNVVTGATMAFRACFRQSFTPIPTHLPNIIHDAWIALTIAAQAEARFINEPTMKYRQHAGQQLGINWRGKTNDKFKTRTDEYDFSINFYKKELKRFFLLREAFERNSVFTAHLSEINAFIKQNVEELEEKIAHYEARKTLSRNKIDRVMPIFNEVLTGRYKRFSKGLASAVKDFFEKQ